MTREIELQEGIFKKIIFRKNCRRDQFLRVVLCINVVRYGQNFAKNGNLSKWSENNRVDQ